MFKIDNKQIKNEIVKAKHHSKQRNVHSTPEKNLKKVLDKWHVVNKETQSLMLTFNRFHILF